LFGHVDAANVDLKGFTEDFYRHICGGELHAVLDTLEYLHETDVWFELTTLLIPGLNDSDAELDAMTRWVVGHLGPDVPMHFTAFHPDYRMLDRPPTPPETLSRARHIALANGVRHAYTGNVHDPAGQSTACPGCGTRVIRRDWYQLGAYRLDEQGTCQACGTALPGVFDRPARGRGPVRQPVVLGRVGAQPRTAPSTEFPGLVCRGEAAADVRLTHRAMHASPGT
jgi:pyruvate formate lyase activating enzyme